MKTLRLFLALIFAVFMMSAGAQNIENTLGAAGKFKIFDNSPTQLFSAYSYGSTARVDIGRTTTAFDPPYGTLNIAEESGTTAIGLNAFYSGAFPQTNGCKIHFGRARGSGTTPTIVGDGDLVGSLNFWGYRAGSANYYTLGASIETFIDGTPTPGTTPPMKFVFSTAPSGVVNTERLIIRADGTINIPLFAGGGSRFIRTDNSGNLSASATLDGMVSSADFATLKKENQVLKSRLEALEAKMESLLKKQ
jgi:hypothetical protein